MKPLQDRLAACAPFWGQWQLDQRIYHSSNCSVYILRSVRLEEPTVCVMKVLSIFGAGVSLTQQLEAVTREILLMEQLRDCGGVVLLLDDALVPIFDEAGELVGYDCLMRMEKLTCLAELLRDGESLSEQEVRTLAEDMGRALSALHSRGVIHRDVKPANLYRTASGHYQLGDFGTARRMLPAQAMQTVTGTTAYMAPEMLRGDGYDERSDLYALGMVLYQLLNHANLPLTTEASSYAQRQQAQARRCAGARLPRPAGGDRRLQKIVLRLLRADPARRFPSAQALLDALTRKPAPLSYAGWALSAAFAGALALSLLFPAPEPPPVPTQLDNSDTQKAPEPAADTVQEPDVTHRYTVIQAQMSYEEAAVYCESRGGHLATILNQEQFDAVAALLEESGVRTAWLGADNYNSSAGFRWVTGETFDFAVWAIGEPNNANGREHYLMMYHVEGQGWCWNDSSLTGMDLFTPDRCGFVCQWDDADG